MQGCRDARDLAAMLGSRWVAVHASPQGRAAQGPGVESESGAHLGSSRTQKRDLAAGRGGKDQTPCLRDRLLTAAVPQGRQWLRCHRRPSACFPSMLTASAASTPPSPAGPQPFNFHSHCLVSFTTQLSPSLNCAQQALAGGKKVLVGLTSGRTTALWDSGTAAFRDAGPRPSSPPAPPPAASGTPPPITQNPQQESQRLPRCNPKAVLTGQAG